jgi:hypothetical protein
MSRERVWDPFDPYTLISDSILYGDIVTANEDTDSEEEGTLNLTNE